MHGSSSHSLGNEYALVLFIFYMMGVVSYAMYILQVYFGKTKEMVCTLRPPSEVVMRLPDS